MVRIHAESEVVCPKKNNVHPRCRGAVCDDPEKNRGGFARESNVKYAVSAQGIPEPTVNRYCKGGGYVKHFDEMAVSVIVLLDDQGFEGQ